MSLTIPAATIPVVDDPLFPAAGLLPLGRPLGRPLGAVTGDDATPNSSDRRPFGLRFATVPTPIPVDLTEVRYDSERQMSVDGAGAPVYGRHSTGKTSTRTSDGYKSMDSDTDHTED